MWSLLIAASFSVGYACIPTESPDDRPHIPGVFTTTGAPVVTTTTTIPATTTTTTPTTTSTSTSTTSTTTSTTTTTSTSTTTTTTIACPMDYRLFTDPTSMTTSCYYVSPFDAERLTWANARLRCQMDDGDLAIITSTEENDFVSNFANEGVPTVPAPSVYTDQVWLGGMCTTNPCGGYAAWMPANWLWHDGTNLDPSSPFYTNPVAFPQPDGFAPDCLSLLTANNLFPPTPNSGIGLWHDLECWRGGRYVCKVTL